MKGVDVNAWRSWCQAFFQKYRKRIIAAIPLVVLMVAIAFVGAGLLGVGPLKSGSLESEKELSGMVAEGESSQSGVTTRLLYARGGYAQADFSQSLHALSAVLMDADSGRVLYAKEGDAVRAMASTTKVMTCIIALENAKLSDVFEASSYAASMPKVHMGVRAGEKYRMEDLLYALMLESYNDAAVVIAEGVAGSVENFAALMNEKARELGALHTNFVTPNGLDAQGHETTAADLALILRYAIQNETFCQITQTRNHRFTDVAGKRSYYVTNHNSLLTMLSGAISGKTGYTGEAGYCYVGAAQQGGVKLIVALLGSGWPPHKTYKWSDCLSLMSYGFQNYHYEKVLDDYHYVCEIPVTDGIKSSVEVHASGDFSMLLCEEDAIEITVSTENVLTAPVYANQKVGEMTVTLNGESIWSTPVYTMESSRKENFWDYFLKVVDIWAFMPEAKSALEE